MKKLITFASMVALLAVGAFGEIVTQDMVYKGRVDFDNGCIWRIKGTEVTATAAELNIVDGLTASTTELNVWDGTVQASATSGTSKYKLYLTPDGSAAGDLGRTDLLHMGGTNNCQSISNAVVGAYFSLGRAAMYPTSAAYPDGTWDHGLRVDAINYATNNTDMGLRGAHIKAKTYSGSTVGGLEGLFVECIGDGTEDNGEAIALKIGSDNTTIDYGINMDLMTADVADIYLQNAATIGNVVAGTLSLGATTVAITNNATVAGTLGVTGVATFNGAAGFSGLVTNMPGACYTQVMNTGTAFTNVYNQSGWLISHNP